MAKFSRKSPRAQRKKVDPAQLQISVRADDSRVDVAGQ